MREANTKIDWSNGAPVNERRMTSIKRKLAMLADPQSITYNAVASDYARTTNGANQNTYTIADGLKKLTVKQNSSKERFRREIRLTETKVAADPISGINKEISASVYLVIDEPRWGFSDSDLDKLKDALTGYCTDAVTNKVLLGEY